MNSLFSKILFPVFYPTRIPQLYFGPNAAPRDLHPSEKRAEQIFVALQILSFVLFLLGGVYGWFAYGLYGLVLFALLGYIGGVWIRRSLGIRGQKPTTGFFQRMRQRAFGSRPGILEMLVEQISGHPLSRQKCLEVLQVYERSTEKLKNARSVEEQHRILAELDRRVQQMLRNKPADRVYSK
jgi:hypothetical protein